MEVTKFREVKELMERKIVINWGGADTRLFLEILAALHKNRIKRIIK
ncbi:MAG: hypothetical protein QW636_07435 [Candidatus Bathyarchaeia archaeon]